MKYRNFIPTAAVRYSKETTPVIVSLISTFSLDSLRNFGNIAYCCLIMKSRPSRIFFDYYATVLRLTRVIKPQSN